MDSVLCTLNTLYTGKYLSYDVYINCIKFNLNWSRADLNEFGVEFIVVALFIL